jgi:hypothetical protein
MTVCFNNSQFESTLSSLYQLRPRHRRLKKNFFHNYISRFSDTAVPWIFLSADARCLHSFRQRSCSVRDPVVTLQGIFRAASAVPQKVMLAVFHTLLIHVLSPIFSLTGMFTGLVRQQILCNMSQG